MSLISTRDAEDYAGQLRRLLPHGAAWDYEPDGVFAQLMHALAEEFARIDLRALAVIEEADPRTAVEMLGDWERIAGLPDDCIPAPESVPERQAAVHYKLTRPGSQSIASYIEMAGRAGYIIDIEEHRPARVGMRLGGRCYGQRWAHVWTVHIKPDAVLTGEEFSLAQAYIGDRLGIRLRGWGSMNVECLINRSKPAQTTVIFAYDVDPEPSFWIDFNQ